MNESAIVYVARKILDGQPLESNRAILSLDEKFIPSYDTFREIKRRGKISEEFKKIFGL